MDTVVARLRWSHWAGWVLGLALPVLGLALLAIASWRDGDLEQAILWLVFTLPFLLPLSLLAMFGWWVDRLGGVFVVDRQGLRHCVLANSYPWDWIRCVEFAEPIGNGRPRRLLVKLRPRPGGYQLPQVRNSMHAWAGFDGEGLFVSMTMVRGKAPEVLEQVLRVGRQHGWSPADGRAA